MLGTVPDVDKEGLLAAEPMAILPWKLAKKGNHAVVYVLVSWSNRSREEATWELHSDIAIKFPNFPLDA